MDVQADAATKAGTSPHDEARGTFAFAGLVLDLDACTLQRESGEAIALTRGEFALLREFVRLPGRVLSRDFLLDAAVGGRNSPFDRSVDVMVGRLRKKVEPDPKQPSVIQTVPGEGYRFTAPLSPRKRAAEAAAATTAAWPGDTPSRRWPRARGLGARYGQSWRPQSRFASSRRLPQFSGARPPSKSCRGCRSSFSRSRI